MEENERKKAVYHSEDMVMKTAMAYFAEELLPVLGIREQIVGIAPTELIVMDARQLFMDFNFILADGSQSVFENSFPPSACPTLREI